MGALYKLQAKVFFRRKSSLFTFLVVTIYMFIFGSVIKYAGYPDQVATQAMVIVFSSVATIGLMNVALQGFGFSLIELKNSVLLKRIGSTRITKSQIIVSVSLWALTLLMMVVAYLLFFVYLFSNAIGYFPPFPWSQINWSGFFLAVIIGGIAMFAVGIFFISISRNSEIYNVYTTLYFFAAAILGGLFTPGANAAWMDWIGRLTPVYWTANLMSYSGMGAQVFHLGGYSSFGFESAGGVGVVAVPAWEASLNWFMPIVYFAIFAGISTKTFKWS